MRLTSFTIAAGVCLQLTATAQSQQAVFPPGARVGLVAPTGFAPATSFVGFENQASGGAIVIADLPRATFDEMLPTFTPEGMARGGIRAGEPSRPWSIANGEGRILRGRQDSRGVAYRRWLVLARTGDTAALVSAMVPEASADAATGAIEAALRTISFRPPPSLDEQVAALPFRVGTLVGFRPVLVTGGLSLLLTEGPVDKPQAATQPVLYLIAHVSGAQGSTDDSFALARRLFAATPTLTRIQATKDERRSEGTVSHIEGKAVEGSSGAEVEVVQIVRFVNGGYMRAVGIFRREDAPRYRDRFERLAGSIVLR